ncbi:WYL domain-containing protein [Clostridium sp.]|uniref:WYL domain-containing protein n=1 Tax=Clostridium sp. TaxID=1506 RepID=UPI0026397E49|nr:WYL domain-containing protein [Clostridium sp.]
MVSFSVSNLEWAANLIFSLQDKVKVIAPLELKEAIKTRIKRIHEHYKDDRYVSSFFRNKQFVIQIL